MNCRHCNQPVEPGAAFCGNCGQSLAVQFMATATAAPSYAVAVPNQGLAETQALLSCVFGLLGIAGAFFMAVLGIGLGITGIILGTLARASPKRTMSNLGIVASSLAIVAGLAVWAYVIEREANFSQKETDAPALVADKSIGTDLATQCYKVDLIEEFNFENGSQNCDMKAYNGRTMATSTEFYKVYANKTTSTKNDFAAAAKAAINKDIANTLPGYTVDQEMEIEFAGSPAYVVHASSETDKVAVVEAAVLHETSQGENVFVLVHANGGETSDLQVLEAGWEWR